MLLYSKPVLASIQAPPSIQPGAELPVGFQLEKLKRVATVSFVFERDAALTGGTTEDKNGFTALYSTCISNPAPLQPLPGGTAWTGRTMTRPPSPSA